MNAPDGTPVDSRHPSWCDPLRCEAGRDDILGDHRSRIMTIRPLQPFDLETDLWLVQPVHDPVTETEPWIFLRFTGRRHNGEIDSVSTFSLRLDEADAIAEALATLVELGQERRYVTPEEWR